MKVKNESDKFTDLFISLKWYGKLTHESFIPIFLPIPYGY